MNSVVESLLKLLTLVRSPLAVKALINNNKGKFSFIKPISCLYTVNYRTTGSVCWVL